jgi:hypothetical protein
MAIELIAKDMHDEIDRITECLRELCHAQEAFFEKNGRYSEDLNQIGFFGKRAYFFRLLCKVNSRKYICETQRRYHCSFDNDLDLSPRCKNSQSLLDYSL